MTDTPPATPEPDVAADEPAPPIVGVWDALARFQADLPDILADQTAKVEKDGRLQYTYQYADLAAVSRAVLRRLGALGVAWVTIPRSGERGIVLEYHLRHAATGEEITGEWYVGTGDPQQLGSRITYARRYALCAVTGVFPAGEDDDGARGGSRQAAGQPAAEQRPAQQRRERATPVREQTNRPQPAQATDPVEDQGVPGPQTRAAEQEALRASVARAQEKVANPAAGPRPAVPAIDQLASVAEFLEGDTVFPTAQLASAATLFGEVQQAGKTGWRHLGSGPSLVDIWESRLCRALAASTSADGARRIEAMVQKAGMQGSHPKVTTALIEAYERHGVSPITPDN